MGLFFACFWFVGILLTIHLLQDSFDEVDWQKNWWKAVLTFLLSWISIFVFAECLRKEMLVEKNDDEKKSRGVNHGFRFFYLLMFILREMRIYSN